MLGIKTKTTTQELSELGIIVALMIACKESLRVIPNVHPITLLIIFTTIIYGKKALYCILCFNVIEILIYGLGIWTIMYFYVWPILFIIAYLLRNTRNWIVWSTVAGLHGLLFGAMCSLPYLFLSGFKAAFAYFISGVPYDLIHAVSNFIIVFFLLPICLRIYGKIKNRDYENLT